MRTIFVAAFVLIASQVSAQDSLLPTLLVLRASYPTPMSKAQAGELLTVTAQMHPGWVLLSKPSGNNCPAMQTRVACDYLVWAATGQGFDVLRDEEGDAEPVWQRGDVFTPDRYVLVSPLPDPGTPPPSSGTNIDDELDAIISLLTEIRNEQITIGARQDAMQVFMEQQVLALRQEHADAVKQVDDKGTPWWQVLLTLLAAVGGGAGVAK